jgi:hypothetical protein
MKVLKISSLWCNEFSENSIFFHLIKDISKREIKIVRPCESDLIFIGAYENFIEKRKVLNLVRKKIKIIDKIFPNIDLYFLNRKIKPLRIFISFENRFLSNVEYDFSITQMFNMHDKTHLRFPLWKELIDWSDFGIKRSPTKFVKRFDNFYNINKLIMPQGDKFMKKPRKIGFFSSHLNEPKRNIYYFLSKYFSIDGYGPYFDKQIKDHNSSNYSKKTILKDYAFNLCPENSLYPGYYTERVPEAFLSECLPITWADHGINKDFNEKAFVNLINYYDNYYEICHLLQDEDYLKKFTNEPLLHVPPDLNQENIFIKKVLDCL